MCTVHRNRTHSRRYIRNMYCEQNQNIFQTGHQKYVPCTETEHIPEGILKKSSLHRNKTLSIGTSEVCSVQRNKLFSRRYIRGVYCAQKQNTLQAVHQIYVVCTETEQFPDGTNEGVFIDDKMTFKTKLADIHSLQYTNIRS